MVEKRKIVEISKKLGLKLPQLQLLIAQDGFLARLARLKEGRLFVWKGGSLIIRAYRHLQKPRFTTDVDLLVKKSLAPAEIMRALAKTKQVDLSDELSFGRVTRIPLISAGLSRDISRFAVEWEFRNRPGSQKLKVDVSTGDFVEEIKTPFDCMSIMGSGYADTYIDVYPAEYVFAEKMHAVIRYRTGNTRLKDIIDMWSLIERGLDKHSSKVAIEKCFAQRGSNFDTALLAEIFSDSYYLEEMEKALRRNFPHLNLPSVGEMFRSIEEFVSSLG